MSDYYTIPDDPQYERDIRKLKNTDPASAERTFNPLFERLIENTQAVMESAGSGKGTKNATYVVGTVKSEHTKGEVDYLCTGESDQDVINSAIAALPDEGGKILLLEGEYRITSQIRLNKGNIVIQGMGNSTVIFKDFKGYAIRVLQPYCQVLDLRIEGDPVKYPDTSYNAAIFTYVDAQYLLLENVRAVNQGGAGVLLGTGPAKVINCDFSNNSTGISFNASDAAETRENIHVIRCTCNGNKTTGIRLLNVPQNCFVEGCEVTRNQTGIKLEGEKPKVVRIENCTVMENDANGITAMGNYITVMNNTVIRNGGCGVELNSNNSLLANNVLYENTLGPYQNGSWDNTVVNNVMETFD